MWLEVQCPSCGETTHVKEYPATQIDPKYVDRDCCDECGEALDFEDAEPLTLYDIEEMRYATHPDM